MRKLLFSLTKKDFTIQTFKAGGKGGGNQNSRNTGVRIIHKESGAKGEARDSRYHKQNKRAAFRRLCSSKKFKDWVKYKAAIVSDTENKIQKQVDEWMKEENFKVEIL